MILETKYIELLFDIVRSKIAIPKNSSIVLEGSIAEGFGNSSSDIDFLIITENEEHRPTIPLFVFYNGRRIEVRFRSVHGLRDQANFLSAVSKKNKNSIKSIEEMMLNRQQRFTRSYVIENPALANELKNIFPFMPLSHLISRWFEIRAVDRSRYAIFLFGFEEYRLARYWAQAALIEAAKAYVSKLGESYTARKWIFHQLKRAEIKQTIIQELRSLFFNMDRNLTNYEYIKKCISLVHKFGIKGCEFDPNNIHLKRRRSTTTWTIGDNIHVVRDKKDVFLFNENVGTVWRNLLFDVPLNEVLGYFDFDLNFAKDIIVTLQKLKLIQFTWRGGETVKFGDDFTIPSSSNLPLLSFYGLHNTKNHRSIQLAPISAKKFAYTGMALIWENMMVENLWEDLIGGIENEQWELCEHRLREIIQHTCFIIACTYGVPPRPPMEDKYEDFIFYITHLPGIDQKLLSKIDELTSIHITSKVEAEFQCKKVSEFVQYIRHKVYSINYPKSFISSDEWQRTLDLIYDWVRLGAYVDSDFPADDVRDVLAISTQQKGINEN